MTREMVFLHRKMKTSGKDSNLYENTSANEDIEVIELTSNNSTLASKEINEHKSLANERPITKKENKG